jgi:hypothetical protein
LLAQTLEKNDRFTHLNNNAAPPPKVCQRCTMRIDVTGSKWKRKPFLSSVGRD